MGDVNHEPTMEEILASIKKIIAEDGDDAVSAADVRSRRKPARPDPVPEDIKSDDILELTDPVEAESASDDDSIASIVSEETVRASQAAFASLTAISKTGSSDAKATDESHPLEGLVREMLRPMLKEWLDANLPTIVETMVAEEISRIRSNSES